MVIIILLKHKIKVFLCIGKKVIPELFIMIVMKKGAEAPMLKVGLCYREEISGQRSLKSCQSSVSTLYARVICDAKVFSSTIELMA